jgi:hypothetical protein
MGCVKISPAPTRRGLPMVPTSAQFSIRCLMLASAPAFHPVRHFSHKTSGPWMLGLSVIIITWIPSRLRVWPASSIKGGEIIFLGFTIRHPVLPAKLMPWNFSIRNQIMFWVVIEAEVLYHVNVDYHFELMTFLHLSRPNKMNLWPVVGINFILDQSQENH